MTGVPPIGRATGSFLLPVAVFLGCGSFFTVDIRDILNDPRKYEGKTVTIKGEVSGSLNLLVVKAYTVRDHTGEIVVITERAVPRSGDRVKVKGRVNQAFAIAGENLVVLIEELPR